ncbi:DUF2793 domain-containing protein [Sphingorhabdus pulchriflava]|uniref:DUF2793 domain-containing protein n=1 Tax=Sphingorhabdus pulchriflava TaxID=2292257 RepID=A0A371BFU0_9SPHN|nr:DUF2793 domain-containing protein [Sphingorhabdus pulchriflava]RDV06440.1 DUF2793 domain-containing protein [Sphingorhabdus pulchriflava]
MTYPKTGGTEYGAAQATPWVAINDAQRRFDALANRAIIVDRDLTAPPGSCADGANYLVAGSPTGLWSGQAGKMATAVGPNAANGWQFQTVAVDRFRLGVQDENVELEYQDGSWVNLTVTGGGLFTLPVMAPAMVARTSNGAAAGSSESPTNKIMLRTFDFDSAADEFVQFFVPMPKRWNEGTLLAEFIWTAGTTGDVVWAIQAIALSNDDPIDASWGAAQTVTDGVTAADDVMISARTGTITVGGSPADNDLVAFQIYRDADNGSDTLSADAKLIGIRLLITTNAADDS